MTPEAAPAEVTAFLFHEANLLDERRFEAWLGLFAADAYYWMPISPRTADRAADLALADDDMPLLKAKVGRLALPSAHTERPPRRFVRTVTNVVMEAREGDLLVARSKLTAHGYRVREPAADEAVSFAATVRHALRARGAGFEIAWKRVDLINSEAALRLIPEPL